jgi:hypothetical protein
MDNIFLIAGIIAVIYFIIKFIEMRLIEKDSKPLKYLIRDSLLVYFSVLTGNFIIDQIHPFIEGNIINATPTVFTDNPNF